jgi:hypothetical protein
MAHDMLRGDRFINPVTPCFPGQQNVLNVLLSRKAGVMLINTGMVM